VNLFDHYAWKIFSLTSADGIAYVKFYLSNIINNLLNFQKETTS